MKGKKWLVLPVSLAIVLLANSVGVTMASFVDLESSDSNTFEAWTSRQWLQTTEGDFNAGVLNNVDTSLSPGDVQLENIAQEPTTSVGSDESWYTDWSYRKKITIDHTKVAANLTNFPVLISLSSDSDLAAHTQSDGDDILFTSSNGTTKISHEIEEFDNSTGKLIAWVKVPSLSTSMDTDIYMYYGNSTCSNQEDITGVWDSDFKMVQHLQESPNDDVPGHLDSTSNNNDGTPKNFQDGGGGSTNATGQIDGADDFAGDDDWVNCGEGGGTLDFGTGDFTLEAWVKTTETNTRYILSKFHPNAIPFIGYVLQIDNGKLCAILADGDMHNLGDGNATINDDSWHYLAVAFNRDGDATYYVDGTNDRTVDISTYTGDTSNNRVANLAQRPALFGSGTYFGGIIDEVRFSDIDRGGGWIKTCYNNQNSPSSFYSVGSEEKVPEESWHHASWSRRAPVTINNTGSALTDYQVRVDVTHDTDMQPDFDDIRFVDSDDSTELSHWRESYNASTSAVFWVKVPSIPSGSKTIYMYYGNPAAGSATNGAGTFIVFVDKNSTAGWSESNLTVETSGDFLRFYNPTSANVGYALRYDLTSPSVWSLEARFKNESLGASDQVLFALLDGNASNRFTHTISPHWLAQNKCGYYDGAEHEIGTDLWAEGTEYIFIHRVDESNNSTGVDFYVCDTSRTLLGSAEDIGFAVGAPTDMDGIGIGDGAANATCDAYFRWIFLRNYASPEPTASIGLEDGWSRRAPVTINNTGSALTDYQAMVDITFDADMQPDFDDIRFRDSDGSTELSHWREDYVDSTSAIFWVKVPSIPSGNKTIYMYYGNDAASSASDGDATFEFFDDFEDGDISDWFQYGSGTVQIANDGGNFVLLKTANNDPNGGYSLFNNGALSNFEAVFRTKRINETGGNQNRYGIEDSSFNGYGPRMYDFNSLPSNFAIERRTGGLSTNLVIKSTSAYEWDTWMTVKFRKSGDTLEFELYDSTGSLVESISTSNSLYNSFDRFVVHGGWEYYTDDIRVRKYIQPTYASLGTIESQVLNTGISGDRWDALFWDETVPAGTDITFEVRASDTLSGGFPDTAWIPVGGTSPVTSGLPSGQYMQWRATLTTSNPSATPVLHEVRVYHY